jgi:hypothetical protein
MTRADLEALKPGDVVQFCLRWEGEGPVWSAPRRVDSITGRGEEKGKAFVRFFTEGGSALVSVTIREGSNDMRVVPKRQPQRREAR